jgi:ribonuclease BN (tRNA processing enzyme)
VTIDVRFIGTGDAFGSGGRAQACILLRAENTSLLVDCGATSLLALRRTGVDPSEIDAVVVSHFHGDHFGGIPYLILDGQFRHRTRPLTIAGPAGIAERVRTAMETAFPGSSSTVQAFGVRYLDLGATDVPIASFAVRGIPVVHTPGSDAMGLRIRCGDRSVAYSGDTAWTEALVALASDVDLFICEAYSFAKAIPYHLSYQALKAHRSEITARRVVVTHVGPDLLEHRLEVDERIAEDGMALSL